MFTMRIIDRISVNKRLWCILAVFIATVSVLTIDIITTLQKNRLDGTVINVAGRQRMLTKKFASEVMLSVYEGHKSQHGALNYDNTIKLYEQSLEALKFGGSTFSDLPMKKSLTLIENNSADFKSQLSEVKQLWLEQKELAFALLNSLAKPSEEQVDTFMLANHATLAAMHKAVLTYAKYADNNISQLKQDIIWISIGGLSICIILSLLIGRSIIQPLSMLVKVSQETAQGDLDDKPYVDKLINKSELGKLAQNVQGMRHALSTVLVGLKSSSTSIGNLSNRVGSLSNEVKSSYGEEQNKYQEITQISESLVDSFDQVAVVVKETLESAEQSKKSAQQGLDSVNANITAVDRATAESHKVSDNIQELSSVADKVYNIIDVIQTIAEQTNLLALNAAIEAARAGEQGRGFAVVADEVRVLASKTNHSTGEISTLLNDLTERVNIAVNSVGQLQTQVENSRDCSKDTAQTIESISNIITHTVEQQSNISTLIQEQSLSISELRHAQEYLSQLLERTSKKIISSSDIAVDMSELARGISTTLDEFTLSQKTIRNTPKDTV